MNGLVYVPPLPASLEELRQRFTTALQTVAKDMLLRVLEELEYQIDVCVSQAEHILNIFEIGYDIHASPNFSFKL